MGRDAGPLWARRFAVGIHKNMNTMIAITKIESTTNIIFIQNLHEKLWKE